METQKLSLDEIVFENRNKDYGAYQMRRSYSKNLSKALFVTVLFFLSAITVPLVANFFKKPNEKKIERTVGVSVGIKAPPIEKIKIPEPIKQTKPVPVFTPPVIVDDPNATGDIDQGELIDKNVQLPPSDGVVVVDDGPKNTGPIAEPEPKPEIFVIVEEMPEFPGGEKARLEFFANNIVYPQMAKETDVKGLVVVQFVVNEDGSISDIKLLRTIGGGCDEEALRVIKLMPKWKAGKQNNKEVRVIFNMPITFTLRN